jgi:hypothetical protein
MLPLHPADFVIRPCTGRGDTRLALRGYGADRDRQFLVRLKQSIRHSAQDLRGPSLRVVSFVPLPTHPAAPARPSHGPAVRQSRARVSGEGPLGPFAEGDRACHLTLRG